VILMIEGSAKHVTLTHTCALYRVVMMVPAAFLLVFGVARLWFLSKRSSLPLDMTSNWLYFAKMVCAKKINNKKMLYI
jgi:hypothetical protein